MITPVFMKNGEKPKYQLVYEELLLVQANKGGPCAPYWVRAWMARAAPTVVLVCQTETGPPTDWWTTRIACNVFRRILPVRDAGLLTRYYQWDESVHKDDCPNGNLQRVRFQWAGLPDRQFPVKSIVTQVSWSEFNELDIATQSHAKSE